MVLVQKKTPLRRASFVRFEVVAGWPSKPRTFGLARFPLVQPMVVRLLVWIAEDRLINRLNRNFTRASAFHRCPRSLIFFPKSDLIVRFESKLLYRRGNR